MPKKRSGFLIGILVALLVVLGGSIYAWQYFKSSTQTNATAQKPDTHLQQMAIIEAPLSSHRAQSTTANIATTTKNPWGIAVDATHGFVWVAEPGCNLTPTCQSAFASYISKYSFADGNFIEDFSEPTGYSSPLFVAVDSAGHVWFTEPNSDAIGELDPQGGNWNQWKLPKGSAPYDLVFDHNGNLWFTQFLGNEIGFLNPSTHHIVENRIPSPDSRPYGITVAPDGTIWFAENRKGLGQIGSFTPTTTGKVSISEHAVAATQPHLITADKAGNIWFSMAFAGGVGVYHPSSGTSTSYPVSAGYCPTSTCFTTHISGISVDSRGYVWFTDSLSQRVGYLIPSSGVVRTKVIDKFYGHPHDGLVVDQSNTVWFSEQNGFELVMWPKGF